MNIDRSDFNERQERLFDTTIFLAKIIFAGLIVRGIVFLNPDTYILQKYLALLVAEIFMVAGWDVGLDGIILNIGENLYEINQDCLGWKSMAAFVALIFASTNRYRKHLKFVLAGLFLILFANLIRILSTIYLAELGIISWDIIHGFLWRWGLTFFVLILWSYWLFRQKNENL